MRNIFGSLFNDIRHHYVATCTKIYDIYVDICMKSEHMRSLINRRVAVDSYVAYDTNAYRAHTSVACAHDTIPYDQPHDQSAIVSGRKRERERG